MTAQMIAKTIIIMGAGIPVDSINMNELSNSNINLKRIWTIIKAIAAFASFENFVINFNFNQSF